MLGGFQIIEADRDLVVGEQDAAAGCGDNVSAVSFSSAVPPSTGTDPSGRSNGRSVSMTSAALPSSGVRSRKSSAYLSQ